MSRHPKPSPFPGEKQPGISPQAADPWKAKGSWPECVACFASNEEAKCWISRQRGYDPKTIPDLIERNRIGLYDNRIAFPVCNPKGQIVGVHCGNQVGQRGKHQWIYVLEGIGEKQPYTIGDSATASVIHVTESTWDAIQLANALGFNKTLAVLSTDGASNSGRLRHVPALLNDQKPDLTIYIWPQNDEASEKWLQKCASIVKVSMRSCKTPPPFADIDAYLRQIPQAKRSTALAFIINDAVPVKVKPVTPKPKSGEGKDGSSSSSDKAQLEKAKQALPLDVLMGILGYSTVVMEGSTKKTIRCPFHDDRKPSLSIDLEKNLWNCKAGCGGGDQIEFLRRTRGFVEREEAIEEFKFLASVVRATPEAVELSRDFATLLAKIEAWVKRYVAFTSIEQSCVVALWIAHTWVFEAFDFTPYLNIGSPLMRCGKSKLLDCLGLLVHEPWRVVLPSEAVLYRKIEIDAPTLLLDEVDAIFTKSKDGSADASNKEGLRSALNAGFERGATVPRCVGRNFAVVEFGVFCPKAIAGIGHALPDTIDDRSIRIWLERVVRSGNRKPAIQKLRKREARATSIGLQNALMLWAYGPGVTQTLSEARPKTPDPLDDRQQDICEPLLAIAEFAGGKWPERARKAVVKLAADKNADSDDDIVVQLDALHKIFLESGEKKHLSTSELIQSIKALDNSPFPLWWSKDDVSEKSIGRSLARLLKPFGVRPAKIRLGGAGGGASVWGYRRADLEPVWKRYAPLEKEDEKRLSAF